MPAATDAAGLQAELNRSTAGGWHDYASHRAQLTELVERGGRRRQPPRTTCILGSGNANDLDVARLLATFHEIHLVDIDGEATEAGLERQRCRRATGVVVHGGVDVDGDWHPQRCFDVVASTAVLSAIIDQKRREIPADDAHHLPHVLGARDRHLRLLVDLVAPGGTAILVTDIVSSDTVPELLDGHARPGLRLVRRLVGDGNFFTGCNPYVLAAAFAGDQRVRCVSVTRPWVWHIGSTRGYLVIAVVATRH